MYVPIAHGVTGSHGFDLTLPQLTAHSVGLSVVALSVGYFQLRVLRDFVAVRWSRLLLAALAFVVAFWTGYYIPFDGPDLDMALGFLVLGAATWPGHVDMRERRAAAAVALLIFPFTGVAAMVVLYVLFLNFGTVPDLRASMLNEGLFWLYLALCTATVGGAVSGRLLEPALPAPGEPG